MDEAELRAIRRAARRQQLTVSEWVRRTLRAARESHDRPDGGAKLEAIRLAAGHSFPTADVEQMLAEIEQGYAGRK
jgi:hypothetical protein